MDKRKLFTDTLQTDEFLEGVTEDNIEDVSENRFRVVNVLESGERVTAGEYQVWTQEEAEAFGYLKGGRPTASEDFKVYRIF